MLKLLFDLYLLRSLFEFQDKLIKFRDYFNGCHTSMSFSHEVERDEKLSFVDVNIFREEGQFVTNVYASQPLVWGLHTF